MRQDKQTNYMQVAEVCSLRSHDTQTKVGAALIKNSSGAIIATGYNGFVRGAPDDKLPTTRPEKYEYILHAEQNLIANCARHGISMEDCTLYCTHSPCKACMRMLVNCGITKVVAKVLYRDFDETAKMQDVKVVLSANMPDGFYHITYEVDKN
jgi:dCMP deaminase